MKRANNEDNHHNDELSLFVVCDGKEAMQRSSLGHSSEYRGGGSRQHRGRSRLHARERRRSVEHTREKLRYAVRLAGKRIYEKAAADPEFKGMGTTVVVLLIDSGNASRRTLVPTECDAARSSSSPKITAWSTEDGGLTRRRSRHPSDANIMPAGPREVEIDLQVRLFRQATATCCAPRVVGFGLEEEIGEAVLQDGPQSAASS